MRKGKEKGIGRWLERLSESVTAWTGSSLGFGVALATVKDALALHLKLNELVAALQGASNRLIDVEDLSEPELHTLHEHYRRLVVMARREGRLTESHSVEEAERRHQRKVRGGRNG